MSAFRWTEAEVRRALGLDAGDAASAVVRARLHRHARPATPATSSWRCAGERFDAHDFLAPAAAEAGATGAVVTRVPDATRPTSSRYFVVPNTLRALGALGRHRRRRLGARVVGVVGSNGKTTTKDLIRAALAPRFRVHATQGNLNNQIGVPLTLLSAPGRRRGRWWWRWAPTSRGRSRSSPPSSSPTPR